MPTHDEIKRAGGNDVGDWGEKSNRGAYKRPLRIAGEDVDVDRLPPLGGDDANVTARAPLLPPGAP